MSQFANTFTEKEIREQPVPQIQKSEPVVTKSHNQKGKPMVTFKRRIEEAH